MAQFDYAKAKSVGYSDAEIAEFLGQQYNFNVQTALESGYKPEEVAAFLSTYTPPEPQVESNLLRETLDLPLGLARGAVTGTRLVSDVFGAESGVSTALRGAEDYLGDLMSAQSKQDSQEVARIMAEVEDAGLGEQVKAAAKAFMVAPLDFTTQAFGTAVPAILGGIGATYLAPAAPVLAGTAAALGLGAAQGTGVVKSSIYDAVKEELTKAGVPEEQAAQVAEEAQSYGGENLGLILSGTALGALASRTGLEPSLLRTTIGKAASRAAAKDAVAAQTRREMVEMAGRGRVRQGLTTAAAETATEAAQGGQEQYAANVALQREGIDVPTMRGVAGAAALEGLAAAGLGGVAGVTEPGRARRALEVESEGTGPSSADALDDLANDAEALGMTDIAADFRARAQAKDEEDVEEEAPTAETPPTAKPEVAPAAPDMADEDVSEALRVAAAQEEADAIRTAAEKDVAVEEEEVAPTTPPTKPATTPQEELDALKAEVARSEAEGAAREATVEEEVVPSVASEVRAAEPVTTAPEQALEPKKPTRAKKPKAPPATAVELSGDTIDTTAQRVEGTPESVQEAPAVTEGAPVAPEATAPKPKLTLKGKAKPAPAGPAQPKVTVVKQGFRRTEAVAPANEAQPEAAPVEDKANAAKRAVKERTDAATSALKFVQADVAADPTPTAVIEARDKRSMGLANAYRVQAQDPQAKTKAGKLAQETIAHPSVTDKERTTAQARAEELSSIEVLETKKATKARTKGKAARADRIPVAASAEPNPILLTLRSATQAVDSIARTGNKFERALANRLKQFLRGVELVIVTDPNMIPEEARVEFVGDGANAAGLYAVLSDGRKVIYLNNIAGEEGVDNLTFLHEALHAATIGLIEQYYDSPESLTEAQRAVLDDFTALKARAADHVKNKIVSGTATDAEKAFFEVGAFSDPREFVTYGMTHPAMQRILLSIDSPTGIGTPDSPSMLSSFVRLLRRLFGLGGDSNNAFADLIVLTDELLIAAEADIPASVVAAASRKQTKQDAVQDKFLKSRSATESTSAIGAGINGTRKDKNGVLDALTSRFDNIAIGSLNAILRVFSTDDVIRIAGNRLNNLKNVPDRVDDMHAFRNKEMRGLFERVNGWATWQKEKPEAGRTLENLIYATTLLNADPTVHPTIAAALAADEEMDKLQKKLQDPTLSKAQKAAVKGNITKRENDFKFVYQLKDKLEKQGGKQGIEIFQMARDDYVRMLDESLATLNQMIANSSMDAAGKSRLLAKINADFAEAKKIGVYFPLVRYGNYWLRVGKGKKGAFYMFESGVDRDVFAKRLAREQGKTLDELMISQDMDIGNDLDSLRQTTTTGTAASGMLKSIFELIDKGGTQDVAQLKSDVYQLYLYTLPDSSMRRRFIRRKAKTGFNTDALRNYASTQTTAINQLARLKYRDSIELALSSANDELEGRGTDKTRLQTVVNEIRRRVQLEMNPASPDDIVDQFASMGNKLVFYYMMTSPKTALIQFTQLPIVGLPVLARKYGWGKSMAMAVKHLNVFKTLSTTRSDQNGRVVTEWGAPSIQNSDYITKNPDANKRKVLADAWEDLENRGVYMQTYISDLTERGRTPTVDQDPLFSLRTVANFMSGLFHHTERLAREVMAMSAFELAYDAAIAKKVDPKDAFRSAVTDAEKLTKEGLFNYSQFNKPSLFRAPLGRVAFQFMTFPLQMTSYLIRNSWGVIKASPGSTRKESMQLLFGTVGMTALFAGATGLPLYGAMMGLLDAYKESLRADMEDDDDMEAFRDLYDPSNPLGRMNSDLWFRSWFLNQYFGPGSDIANALDLSNTQAEALSRGAEFGPISALTDLNVAVSTELNGLWFSDDTPSDTARGAFEAFALKFGGPLFSMGSNIAAAMDDFEEGQTLRGWEKLSPAMFRGLLSSYRQSQEGQLTRQGDVIMDREFYTTTKLFFRGLGFQSTTEAELQKAGILANQMKQEVEGERNRIIARADRVLRAYVDDPMNTAKRTAWEEYAREVTEFNLVNAFFPIENDTISKSIEGKARVRAMSILGVDMTDRLAPFLYPMLRPGEFRDD